MNEIIAELLKKVDAEQINELLGKLPTGSGGTADKDTVGKIAKLLGADPGKLLSVLPGILQRTEGRLSAEKLLSSIDMGELAKIIPGIGSVKVAEKVSKFAAKRIDEETAKIREVESTLWKGSASSEITKASEYAAECANTKFGENVTEDDIKLMKSYLELAQKARQMAIDRKETLLKAGTDRYSDPVAEMNTAMIKASQAVRTITEKLEAAEKKLGK